MDIVDFDRERIAFLGLTTVKGLGFWTLHKISNSGGSFLEAIKQPGKYKLEKYVKCLETDTIDLETVKKNIWRDGQGILRQMRSRGISLHFRSERSFPIRLRDIPDAPWWVFIEGSVDVLNMPACTVVGSRKISEDGKFLTRVLITSLSGMNIATVSGLAHGVDQIVHEESIRYGIPTIAVLGTGIFNDFPRGSEHLRGAIISHGGTVITEYLPNQSYSAENFVRRNRLQAALGDNLIPCEWSIKSGTAHTVKYAFTYSKKIINIYLPLSKSARPEICFSSDSYEAVAFELPQELDLLHDQLKQNTDLTDSINYVTKNIGFIAKEGQIELDM
jgi:DNA protecting protein DprA